MSAKVTNDVVHDNYNGQIEILHNYSLRVVSSHNKLLSKIGAKVIMTVAYIESVVKMKQTSDKMAVMAIIKK